MLTPPNNEQNRVNALLPGVKGGYMQYRNAATKAATENPTLDMSVNSRFLSEYLNLSERHDWELRHPEEANEERLKKKERLLTPREWHAKQDQERQKLLNDFYLANVQSADEPTQKSWESFMEATRPPTLTGGIMRQFWDKKNGFRLGGFLGALLGGIAGYNMMTAVGGGWTGLIALGLGTVMGSWLGNKAVDAVSGLGRKTPQPSPNAAAQAQGQGPAKTQDAPEPQANEEAAKAAANATKVGYRLEVEKNIPDAPPSEGFSPTATGLVRKNDNNRPNRP